MKNKSQQVTRQTGHNVAFYTVRNNVRTRQILPVSDFSKLNNEYEGAKISFVEIH